MSKSEVSATSAKPLPTWGIEGTEATTGPMMVSDAGGKLSGGRRAGGDSPQQLPEGREGSRGHGARLSGCEQSRVSVQHPRFQFCWPTQNCVPAERSARWPPGTAPPRMERGRCRGDSRVTAPPALSPRCVFARLSMRGCDALSLHLSPDPILSPPCLPLCVSNPLCRVPSPLSPHIWRAGQDLVCDQGVRLCTECLQAGSLASYEQVCFAKRPTNQYQPTV